MSEPIVKPELPIPDDQPVTDEWLDEVERVANGGTSWGFTFSRWGPTVPVVRRLIAEIRDLRGQLGERS